MRPWFKLQVRIFHFRIGSRFSRQIFLLPTLDVQNAFNSHQWVNLLDALWTQFAVAGYLMKTMQNYLRDRKLIYDMNQGRRRIYVTSALAQGPDLWNITYDSHWDARWRTSCPNADDIAARYVENVKRKTNQVIIRTKSWLEDKGLKLTMEKTELMFLTRKCIPLEIDSTTYDTTLTTRKVFDYLGIRLDPRLGSNTTRCNQGN